MGLDLNDISRLGAAAQKQIIQKMQAQNAPKAKKGGNKLHAEKCPGYLLDGTPVTFASKRERKRYGELAMMLRAGQISNLRYQVRYDLIPAQVRADGKKERRIYYDADFVYEKDGQTVVEDSKGFRLSSSATYRLFSIKRKLMLWVHGITVIEV